MRITFRAKLLAVAAAAVLALASLFLGAWLIAQRTEKQILGIQERYLPRVGLRPQLEAQFERIRRGLQDAVAANDTELLASTAGLERTFLEELTAAEGALDADAVRALGLAIEDYYKTAYEISRRLIAGETGERIVEGMAEMQVKQTKASDLLDEVTRFDREELAQAFAAVVEAQRVDARNRLLVSTACLTLVIGLALWISRGLLRRLVGLGAGLQRFGAGSFATPIPVGAEDELGDLATQANQMAGSLERVLWLKAGGAGLGDELRGELEPGEVADRAAAFVARYVGAPVAALYYEDAEGTLLLMGGYALPAGVPETVARGEGLIGQAALTSEITIVPAPPAGSLRLRSGLIDDAPRALVLLPLIHLGKVAGVLELGVTQPWSERPFELLTAVRETITIALEVARARAASAELLGETRRQRQTLEATNRELDTAQRGLVEKARELETASTYKSQFLANMSHELRTPLNAIIGFSELLHDGQVRPEAPEAKEFLGDILTSGRHLLQVINDVLDLSKVEAGKIEFFPELIEITPVVHEVLAILRTTAATRRVGIEAELDVTLGHLYLDPGRLKQVLYNFLSNGLKFTPERGKVTVRARAEGPDHFRIEVEDTGVGIAPADLSRLWHEFQQLQTDGRPRAAGTGLGLAITKRMVEAQGGRVDVRSTVGKGSVFTAVLPRRVPGAHTPAPPVVLSAPRPGAATVLVIEDDAADRAQLVEALTGAGFSVETASTGAQALARCAERRFDAITLDLILPDMSGLDVLSAVRAGPHGHDVPVIVVTVVAERGAMAGFQVNDVLPKPLSPEALLAALTRAGVSPSPSGSVLVVDDDPSSQKLMATTLRQLGYDARCESDGASALAAFHASPASAIVLDLSMPRMDGFEFLARLRAEPGGRRVPVIIWTVKDLNLEEHRVLRASAQAVVSKSRGGTAEVVAELSACLKT